MRKRKALAVLIAPIILGGFLFTNTSYQVNAAEVSDIELVLPEQVLICLLQAIKARIRPL
jgi:hypothetical protein